MIPWGVFERSHYDEPEYRLNLNEHNLYYYFPPGLSQLNRGLDSPMLELAHERQFAISQLRLSNYRFETEHTTRIDLALRSLFHHFGQHTTNIPRRATSPHTEDLVDLCRTTFEPPRPPPFEIDSEMNSPEARKSSTSSSSSASILTPSSTESHALFSSPSSPPNTTSTRTTPPPLAIKDLIDPISAEEDSSTSDLERPMESDSTGPEFYDYLAFKSDIRRIWTDQHGRDRHGNRVLVRARKNTRLRRPRNLKSPRQNGPQQNTFGNSIDHRPFQLPESSRRDPMDLD